MGRLWKLGQFRATDVVINQRKELAYPQFTQGSVANYLASTEYLCGIQSYIFVVKLRLNPRLSECV